MIFQAAEPQPKQATGRSAIKAMLLEMIAHDLTIAQVMVLVDQRVVGWFEFRVSDRFEINCLNKK